MSTFKVTSNVDKIMANIKRRGQRSTEAIQQGMVVGMRLFESRIIRQQMSGRKSSTKGLKRQTGTLARSWFINSERGFQDFIVTLATRTKYAEYHEESLKDKHPRQKIKYLHLIEDFKKNGLQIIARQVAMHLHREFS